MHFCHSGNKSTAAWVLHAVDPTEPQPTGMPTRARALGQALQAMQPQEGTWLCGPCCLGLGLGSNWDGGLKGTRWARAEVRGREKEKRAQDITAKLLLFCSSSHLKTLKGGDTAVKINEGTNLRHILNSSSLCLVVIRPVRIKC